LDPTPVVIVARVGESSMKNYAYCRNNTESGLKLETLLAVEEGIG
jgi:hypothetical protein